MLKFIVELCVAQLDLFLIFDFYLPQIVFFEFIERLGQNIFSGLFCNENLFYIPTQIPYLKKSGSWNIGQKALGQSDCRIFNPLMHSVPKWSDTL